LLFNNIFKKVGKDTNMEKGKSEEKLLDKIIKECAEVIHGACKWKRFGMLNYHPEDVLHIPNYQLLLNEMRDAQAAFNEMRKEIKNAGYQIRGGLPELEAGDKPEASLYTYSQTSQERLASAHPVLQKLFNEVIRYVDCTIICGHREKAAQNLAVAGGHSKTRYPFSPHNKIPASAIDAMPYPIDWQDTERIAAFAGFVLGVAAMKGIDIKWGGDWNGNFNLKDQSFVDMPHYELILD
jgi:peptidoglycan LD-endopeptidase CwlK